MTSFLDLPRELRDRVYSYPLSRGNLHVFESSPLHLTYRKAITDNAANYIRSSCGPRNEPLGSPNLLLLAVNRQIRTESSAVFLSRTFFKFLPSRDLTTVLTGLEFLRYQRNAYGVRNSSRLIDVWRRVSSRIQRHPI